jgi:hypothetical protein
MYTDASIAEPGILWRLVAAFFLCRTCSIFAS